MRNADVYVTGSNAKFLSKDVITTFRGRGDEVQIYPLSYSEYHSAFERPMEATLQEYMLYGGLPQIVFMETDEEKIAFLKGLYEETYLRDIKERYNVKQEEELEILLNILSSTVGSLTNPQKLANTFDTLKKSDLSAVTIKKYLDFICDSFLMERASRYDVKGKKYIDTPYKFYFVDAGLKTPASTFGRMMTAIQWRTLFSTNCVGVVSM